MTLGLLLITGNQTHQENYARAFAQDPRCHLVGLTDSPDLPLRRSELNQELAKELQIPFFPDIDEALARNDVDLVCICAEPERRGALAIKAAQAGKHLYLDKEIATSIPAARSVVEAIQSAGVRSQTFSMVRSNLGHQVRRVLDSGRLGELLGLHCELFFAKGMGGTADLSQPRKEHEQAERFTFPDSKRELLCVGWYPLVLFQWLTGRKVREVSATTSNFFFREHQQNDVEDFASLALEYEGGLQGTIAVGRTGWSSHPSHGVHQVQLVGTRGAVMIDAFRPRLEVFSDAPSWKQPETPHPEDPMGFWSSTQKSGGVVPKQNWWPLGESFQSDASYFLDCIEQDRESDVSAAVGADVLEVILSSYRASARHETVRIG